MWGDKRQMGTEHILSLSYGKDSLACLGAMKELDWPLDKIFHVEVYATATRRAAGSATIRVPNNYACCGKTIPIYGLASEWDKDSPVSFHADGHTVHDFDKRFELEDLGLIYPDEPFR